MRSDIVVAALAVLTALAAPAAAETFRFVESDGTVHLTNTPTDPQYIRMGFSGTDQGWLKLPVPSLALPVPDLAPYAHEIREAAERHGVEEGLIKAVIKVESAFNPRAVSPKGARGLMQLMPGTASMLGVRNSFDPKQNIEGGVRHLRGLIDRFGKDLKLALAAYNAGEQAVVNHGGVPPYRETRDYVTRILGMFAPSPAIAAPAPEPEPALPTYRIEGPDGTVTYTNIRPSRKL